jgi:Putative DNA-binding domain
MTSGRDPQPYQAVVLPVRRADNSMLKLATRDDLQRLIDDEIQESVTLDYKASPALAKDSTARFELCKDVSAFANSAGGQIIYGIEEEKGKPTRIDQGSDLTREWIEQVIDSNVQPRLEGLMITPVPLGGGRHAYVLTISQASTRAPHQAPDKKYYKRQNFQSVPMEDYEIRDTLRRATTPELHVELTFATGPVASIVFPHQSELSNPIGIIVTVTNRSSQPAFHAFVSIGIDTELPLRTADDFQPMGRTGFDQQQYWLGHRFISPPDMPIFKEIDHLEDHRLFLTIAYPSSLLGEHIFHLTTSIQTPGYTATEKWVIHSRGGTLQMSRSPA